VKRKPKPAAAAPTRIAKRTPAAKREHESEMLALLCAVHGYAFQEPKGDKHTISMTAHTVSTMRRVSLLVPIDSALAQGLDKLAKATEKAKQVGISVGGRKKYGGR
jgi:hypothetical protein